VSSVPVDSDLLDRAFELYYVEIKAAVRRCGHSTAAAAEIVHELYVKLAAHPGLLPERSLRVSLCRAAMYLGFKRLGRVPPACSDTACATSPEDRQVLLAIEESDPHSLAPRGTAKPLQTGGFFSLFRGFSHHA